MNEQLYHNTSTCCCTLKIGFFRNRNITLHLCPFYLIFQILWNRTDCYVRVQGCWEDASPLYHLQWRRYGFPVVKAKVCQYLQQSERGHMVVTDSIFSLESQMVRCWSKVLHEACLLTRCKHDYQSGKRLECTTLPLMGKGNRGRQWLLSDPAVFALGHISSKI